MGKEEKEECCSTQLIDFNGEFNVTGLEDFMKTTKLAECERSYVVVAIMGPVSSGKSTLMNHLFHTNFKELDAFKGRTQTTKGIWIAKCVGIEPCTLTLDLEGTEGRERGKDDTAFEKQSALFALAISDIVLINMWCHDIGREHASNKPLLKTVFQVMMGLFSPRKTTLLFVIRDKTKTPLESLESSLREDIQKIWDGISKPQHHKDMPLSDFFNVEVTALSSYESQEKEFKHQVAQLRGRFFHSIAPGGIAGDRRGVVPASEFSFSAQQIWKDTRENKDLNLPALKIANEKSQLVLLGHRALHIATELHAGRIEDPQEPIVPIGFEHGVIGEDAVSSGEDRNDDPSEEEDPLEEAIESENFSQLASDEGWLALAEAVQTGPVSGFGEKLSSILDVYLSEYDMKAMYFDEDVRNLKRQQLESKALHFVYPAYQTILGHLSAKGLDKFKHSLGQSFNKEFAAHVRIFSGSAMLEFEQGCADADIKQANWDASKVREKLRRDIEFHVASVRSAKLSEIMANYKKQLAEALVEPTKSLFEAALFKKAAGRDTWASIRKILRRTLSELSTDLDGFELDQKTFDNMVQNLRNFAVSEVMKKTDEEARNVLSHMEDRQWWMSCIPWGCMPWILNFFQGP